MTRCRPKTLYANILIVKLVIIQLRVRVRVKIARTFKIFKGSYIYGKVLYRFIFKLKDNYFLLKYLWQSSAAMHPKADEVIACL